ncbi:hypothetical protein K439DRAFT_1637501 [Ramaria rubella]|nr:hypothetical protein K439DRAFT_1637501 [Ramaria rubella]
MRFIAIASLLFAASQVALSAPVYSLGRRAQDGGGAWIDVVQRDDNDDQDRLARRTLNLASSQASGDASLHIHHPSFDPSHHHVTSIPSYHHIS